MLDSKKNATSVKTKDKVDLIRFDWAMKTILRNKANFDVLEGFLTALLKQDLKVIEILESESNQESESDKFNRVDLLVKDSNDRNIIIEIQNTRETDYLERILYGTSKRITESVELGETYRDVVKVISISILYFILGRGDDYIYYGTTKLKGIHTGHPLFIKERIKNSLQTLDKDFGLKEKDIFPEYYFINLYKFNDVVNDAADEWVYFLKNNEIPKSFHSKNIQKAKEKFNMIKMSKTERKKYEKFLMNIMSEKDMFYTSKEEGREEGREEGAKDKAIEIAKKMLKDCLSVEDIQKYSGLTNKEIVKLK